MTVKDKGGRPKLNNKRKLHPVTVRLPKEIIKHLPKAGTGERAAFIRLAIMEKLALRK